MDTEITLVETEVRLNVLKTVNTHRKYLGGLSKGEQDMGSALALY